MKKMNKEEDTHKHFQALLNTCTITYVQKEVHQTTFTKHEKNNFVLCTFEMHLAFNLTASIMANKIIVIISTNTDDGDHRMLIKHN